MQQLPNGVGEQARLFVEHIYLIELSIDGLLVGTDKAG